MRLVGLRRSFASTLDFFQGRLRRFCSRGGLEAERVAQVVESGVDLVEGGFDLAGGAGGMGWSLVGREAGQRAEQAGPELHQQHAELQTTSRQTVAAAGAEALDQMVRSEFAQVVAQLGQSVV